MITLNPSTLDWRTQVNIFQAIKRAAQAIDAADAQNAENINEIRAVQGGANYSNRPQSECDRFTLENIE